MGESIEKAVSRSVRIAELESTLAARDAEIERLKALVEKRERQLVWAAKYCRTIHRRNGLDTYDAIEFWDGSPDFLDGKQYDGTRAGLLAAIDEATEKETE